jgi:hypothetical protein
MKGQMLGQQDKAEEEHPRCALYRPQLRTHNKLHGEFAFDLLVEAHGQIPREHGFR